VAVALSTNALGDSLDFIFALAVGLFIVTINGRQSVKQGVVQEEGESTAR
jgi:hypothetical protein